MPGGRLRRTLAPVVAGLFLILAGPARPAAGAHSGGGPRGGGAPAAAGGRGLRTLPTGVATRLPTPRPLPRPDGGRGPGEPSRGTGRPSPPPRRPRTSSPPTRFPSPTPSVERSSGPSVGRSAAPSLISSGVPSTAPSSSPTAAVSVSPSLSESSVPSSVPSQTPTDLSSSMPSEERSSGPSIEQSAAPSSTMSTVPSTASTSNPTAAVSVSPSLSESSVPSLVPSQTPTDVTSSMPSEARSSGPSIEQSAAPSSTLSTVPSTAPTSSPTAAVSASPSLSESGVPSLVPSQTPTDMPSTRPSTYDTEPSVRNHSTGPGSQPTTSAPSNTLSIIPKIAAGNFTAAVKPSVAPSSTSIGSLSDRPSIASRERNSASSTPTIYTTDQLPVAVEECPQAYDHGLAAGYIEGSTVEADGARYRCNPYPYAIYCKSPLYRPHSKQTDNWRDAWQDLGPCFIATDTPTSKPTRMPTSDPTNGPTSTPTDKPSKRPSRPPSMRPSASPTLGLSEQPSATPSQLPSSRRTRNPSEAPSYPLTPKPSPRPTNHPSTLEPTKTLSCPQRYKASDAPSYKGGTDVEVGRVAFRCKPYPWEIYCTMADYRPQSPGSQWRDAWTKMGPCKRETPPPTETPTSIRITQRPITNYPSLSPSGEPSSHPSEIPSEVSTTEPSHGVTDLPSGAPHDSTARPSRPPTGAPAYEKFTKVPSRSPETDVPTSQPSSQATRQPTSQPARTSPAPSSQPASSVSVATKYATIPLAMMNVTFQLRLAGVENELSDDAITLIESSCGVFLASTIESISDVSCEVLEQQTSSITTRRLLEAGHSLILHMLVNAVADSGASIEQVELANVLNNTFFDFGDELVVVVKNSAEDRGLADFTSLGSVEFARDFDERFATSILSAHGSERVRATFWASVASAGVSIAVVLAFRKSGYSLRCQNRGLIRLDDDVATDDVTSLPVTVDCFNQPIAGKANLSPAPPPVPPTKMVSHELRPPIPSDIICDSLSDEENPKEHRNTKLSMNDLLKSYSSMVEDSSSPKVKDLAVEVSLSQGTTLFPLALDKQSRSRYGGGKNDCTPSSMECFAGTQRIRVRRTVLAPSGPLGIIIRQSTEGCKVHNIKTHSVMRGVLFEEDIIISLNGKDVSDYSAQKLTRLIAGNLDKEREFGVLSLKQNSRYHSTRI